MIAGELALDGGAAPGMARSEVMALLNQTGIKAKVQGNVITLYSFDSGGGIWSSEGSMQKAIVSLAVVLALGMDLGLAGDAVGGAAPGLDRQMLAEQKNFLECLVYVYDPGLWISYEDRLYFMPRNDFQREQIAAMKAAREQYAAFTNRETRHQFVAKVLAESGLDADWQKKLLAPYSTTNLALTPVLDRRGRFVERYSVLKTLPRGDVLIKAGDSIYSVMGFGRGVSDAYRTNGVLVQEGSIAYRTESNGVGWIEAFTDAALTAAETAALDQAAAAFQKKAAALGQAMAASQRKVDAVNQTVAASQRKPDAVNKAPAESRRKAPALSQPSTETNAKQDFENLKARARETSPFMEYLLAKAYLEGKGTAKDEKLGLLWMNKAAHDGSGDADTYLEGVKAK
jgi:hypothetical protein